MPSRRSLLALVVVVAALSAAAAGCGRDPMELAADRGAGRGPAGEIPDAGHAAIGEPPSRGEALAEPTVLLLLGDSVMQTLLPSFSAAADVLGARWHDATRWGFGLSADTPGRYEHAPLQPLYPQWRADVAALVAEHRPTHVVTLVGAWDVVDRDPGGTWLRPGRPGWADWYAARVAELARIARAGGAEPVLVTSPCVDTPLRRRVPPFNDALRAAARGERITVVDLHALACPAGHYRSVRRDGDGDPVTVRSSDGVHFEPFAAARVFAEPLAECLRAALASTSRRRAGA